MCFINFPVHAQHRKYARAERMKMHERGTHALLCFTHTLELALDSLAACALKDGEESD